MISLLAAVVVLTAAPVAAPLTPTPASQPSARETFAGAWSASEEEISRGLVAAWRAEPQRRVCATYTPTGERQQRSVCGSLQSWFNGRNQGEVRLNRAPQRLVEEVKTQRAAARQRRAGRQG